MIILKESQPLDNLLLLIGQFPVYENQPKSTLYHNTKFNNLKSILQNGLLLSASRYANYEGNGIWSTSTPNQKGYGGCTVAFDSTGYDLEKVNDDEYRVWEDIKLEDIIFVDFPILYPHRLSDMPKLISEYGYEKTIQVVEKRKEYAEVSMDTIKKLLERVN